MKPKGLKTQRLEIRPYRLNDFEVWRTASLERLPARNRFDRGPVKPSECTISRFKKMLRRHEGLAKKDKVYIYGVFEKKSGTLVGAIDIAIICRSVYQMANLGYQVHNRFWRRGFGRESAMAGLKIGFSQLGLNRLEAAIDFDNPVSQKLARSIGMRREGIKKNYLFENGKWIDQIIFAAGPRDIGLKPTKPKEN